MREESELAIRIESARSLNIDSEVSEFAPKERSKYDYHMLFLKSVCDFFEWAVIRRFAPGSPVSPNQKAAWNSLKTSSKAQLAEIEAGDTWFTFQATLLAHWDAWICKSQEAGHAEVKGRFQDGRTNVSTRVKGLQPLDGATEGLTFDAEDVVDT